MERDARPRPDGLSHLAKLTARPERYHIFHALRVLEAAHRAAPRLGDSARPREDRVRLGQVPEMAFPKSTIAAFEPGTSDRPARLTNRFFGLFGPQGPLPLHLTNYARERQRNHRDPTLVGFADLFTHRMLSLLYRAWSSGEPGPSFDRPDEDRFAEKVAALAGYSGRALQDRDAMPDLAKRYFAAHLASGPRHADGLVAILASFFGARVRLLPFQGSWLELEESDRWRLGAPGGLGASHNLGERVWSRSAKFTLRIGPMGLDEYRRLLPGGAALTRLRAIVRNYCGDALDWDLVLVLRGAEVPPSVLGRSMALGHTSWVGERNPAEDADELHLAG